MSRMAKTVRYQKTGGRTDNDLMPLAQEAVSDVECSAHKSAAKLDTFAGGMATISACCRPALERAEKAFNSATK